MELLIVITIIGILVLIAIPSYRTYTRRAHYTEIVQATAPYKLGVEECYQITSDLSGCSAGDNGVPSAITAGSRKGLVDSVDVKTILLLSHRKPNMESKQKIIAF